MHVVKNAWYVAAWSSELSNKPRSRTLLGQPVLLVRKRDGTPVALGDRCPHRFAPLHLGTFRDDTIQCGYHGLRFGLDGACVENPTGQGAIPRQARIPSYRVVEKDGLVWIWMGDAAAADIKLIPDFSSLDAPTQRHAKGGYLHIKANYQLMVDNLLDLSHVAFLHPAFGTRSMARGKVDISQDGHILRVNRLMAACDAPSYLLAAAGPDGKVDHWLDMILTMPSSMILAAGATTVGLGRIGGSEVLASHIVTPETDNTTHYFFSISQNVGAGSEADLAHIHEMQKQVFLAEDIPMLEGCQSLMGTTDLWTLKPVLLPTDAGPVHARKWLDQMIHEERQEADPISA
jgi:phenylpropionate dioxygenase-like ring-hydroxylating dioxygenase large terminal subunit